jgi:hypothetical protein
MKVKFGSIIVAGRGTLGGHVYSENHYGPFARTKVTPANPQTGDQQAVRNRFETIQFAWRNLTNAERALWELATPDYPRTDFSGTVYFLTGYNLFISLNIPYYRQNGSIMTTPPVKVIPTSDVNGTLTVDFGGTGLRFTYTVAPNEANTQIYFFATRGLSSGITYVSTELRLIHIVSASGAAGVNLTATWNAKYGADPLTDEKIFVRIVPVNTTTGSYGVPYTFSGIQP